MNYWSRASWTQSRSVNLFTTMFILYFLGGRKTGETYNKFTITFTTITEWHAFTDKPLHYEVIYMCKTDEPYNNSSGNKPRGKLHKYTYLGNQLNWHGTDDLSESISKYLRNWDNLAATGYGFDDHSLILSRSRRLLSAIFFSPTIYCLTFLMPHLINHISNLVNTRQFKKNDTLSYVY
jgi:hypothetical protein